MSEVTLEKIYDVLSKYGALQATEVANKLRPDFPGLSRDKLKQLVYSRMKYGANTGAFKRVERPGRRSLYIANVDWRRKDYGRVGGRTKPEARALIKRMRDGPERHTWAEIADELGCSPQAAAAMYQRMKKGKGDSVQEPPRPKENYSLLGDD